MKEAVHVVRLAYYFLTPFSIIIFLLSFLLVIYAKDGILLPNQPRSELSSWFALFGQVCMQADAHTGTM